MAKPMFFAGKEIIEFLFCYSSKILEIFFFRSLKKRIRIYETF